MATRSNPFAGQDVRTLIDHQAKQRADHPFVIWEPFVGEGFTWTYGQFADLVRHFAAGLHARGVNPGDRILIHLENCPEQILAWLGCAYAGAVAVTTNARAAVSEVAYFADHSGAVAAITQPRFRDMVAAAAPNIAWLAVTETDNGEVPELSPGDDELFARITAPPETLPERPHAPMAPFSIQYTSGTTARPKGVLWTHGNFLWGARVAAMHEGLEPADIHHTYLPLFHTNAQIYSVGASLWTGSTVVLQPKFSASRFWDVAVRNRCTWTSIMPFCMKALLNLPLPKQHYFRRWAGGVCDPPSDKIFGVQTIGWWGMTETIAQGILGSVTGPNTPLSLGRSSPAYAIHIINDDGTPAQPGQTGDLFVEGVPGISLFLEYVGDPAATAAAFDDQGRLITGDRIRICEEGALYFADRSKDMLKIGGENVAASEIESVVARVPGVAEVAVVGKEHPMLDECPVAFVIAKSRPDTTLADQIMAACECELAAFKCPHEIRFVDTLPRSVLEKVAKAELRAMLKES